MKKSIALLIAFLLSLILAACGTLEVGVEADLSTPPGPIATLNPVAASPINRPQIETPAPAFTPTPSPEPENTPPWIVYTGKDDNI